MAFVVIGDTHLEKLDQHIPNATELQISAMRSVFEWCTSEGITEVVHVGDLFDNPKPSQDTLMAFSTLMMEFGPAIHMHLIPGNHDFVRKGVYGFTLMKWLSEANVLNLTIYDQPTVAKLKRHKVFMCPWPYNMEPPTKVDFCFGHMSWTGAKRDNGSPEKNGSNPKGNWILGHFHRGESGKRFHYTGSLTQLNVTEGSDRTFTVVDGKEVRRQSFELPYLLEKLRIESDDDWESLKTSHVKNDKTYWYVTLAENIPAPPNWAQDYPKIISLDSEAAEKAEEKAGDSIYLSDDVLEDFEIELKQHSLSSKTRKRARQWAEANIANK